jgi:hypothetical protein
MLATVATHAARNSRSTLGPAGGGVFILAVLQAAKKNRKKIGTRKENRENICKTVGQRPNLGLFEKPVLMCKKGFN